MKKTFIFHQGLFQHHLLSLPPSLLTLSREGPRTFSPLVLTLGPVALYIWQSENGQRGIFFFSRKRKIYMKINKNVSWNELKGLLSQTVLSVVFCSISLNSSLFPKSIFRTNNSLWEYCRKYFSPLISICLSPFPPCSCFARGGRSWTVTILTRFGKPSGPLVRQIIPFFSPSSFTLSKIESGENARNTQFLYKVICILHMERLCCLLCGSRLCTFWQAASERRSGTPMTWNPCFRDELSGVMLAVCFLLPWYYWLQKMMWL